MPRQKTLWFDHTFFLDDASASYPSTWYSPPEQYL